jgi:hypothetical protein
MLEKIVKTATACREANNNMDSINIRDNGSSSAVASNIQQGHQKQEQYSRQLLMILRGICEKLVRIAKNSWKSTKSKSRPFLVR